MNARIILPIVLFVFINGKGAAYLYRSYLLIQKDCLVYNRRISLSHETTDNCILFVGLITVFLLIFLLYVSMLLNLYIFRAKL